MRIFPVMLLFIFVLSCGGKGNVPADVLPMSEMQKVLWDLFRADGLTQIRILKEGNLKQDEENAVLFQKVLASHQLKKEAFFKSYEYYLARPDQFKILMDSISAMSLRYSEEIQSPDTSANTNGTDSTHATQ